MDEPITVVGTLLWEDNEDPKVVEDIFSRGDCSHLGYDNVLQQALAQAWREGPGSQKVKITIEAIP